MVAGILFADDLAIITTSKKGMDKALRLVTKWCDDNRMRLSVTKSKVMRSCKDTSPCNLLSMVTPYEGPIEVTKVFKYLGILLEIGPYRLAQEFGKNAIKKATFYYYTILNLTKTGPDMAELARAIWLNVAIPSVLFGCEVMPLSKFTIAKLDSIQAKVGKLILQLPPGSTNTVAALDAGLMPITHQVWTKIMMFHNRVLHMPQERWARQAYQEHIRLGLRSPYLRMVTGIKMKLRSWYNTTEVIKSKIMRAAMEEVAEMRTKHSKSLSSMSLPWVWFKPADWVNDSKDSEILARFRAGDLGLGNRAPREGRQQEKLCPLCKHSGLDRPNNEVGTTIFC